MQEEKESMEAAAFSPEDDIQQEGEKKRNISLISVIVDSFQRISRTLNFFNVPLMDLRRSTKSSKAVVV